MFVDIRGYQPEPIASMMGMCFWYKSMKLDARTQHCLEEDIMGRIVESDRQIAL